MFFRIVNHSNRLLCGHTYTANIIVAEKAARLNAAMTIDFYTHYKICFWITVACCIGGGTIVGCIATLDTWMGN